MELGIENQVAFVTGAAKGIGLACARTLAREGCRVVVADIDGAAAECAAQAIVQAGGAALARTLDVSRPDSVKLVVADVLANWGGISILVNNAGFSRDSAIAQMSDAQWADVLTVNLSGAFHCIREIAPLMVERAYGRIVNMASRAHFGDVNKANYSASKAGVIGMTRALAIELGPSGVTVNAVAPGIIETERLRNLPQFAGIEARSLAGMPIKRIGQPEEVADAVAFLASARAGFITGEVLHISGGRYG
ncbi:SDR family NAD(P)-dependent oxidoreductase [Bordetella pseudohinzii]|uniref:3-oxoacyl-[acyl-carrier-protein] reductase FabG n=1 Tax=Bordetella pseudohinzii TaxID=1331258 RepID=A0A0J6C5Q7_9BORD|nr:3-oxoacyl-ACP reductase FabG [Bordetella pseudohinzii]ANY17867.1 beta-ketoacyl-ACP reductase [Bordetella pseudohinzii]KMM26493.1 3-oxoacyl-ACP reductase [Bordetella pseudohinzii]KXA77031.1 beta-ketoacyl-ACP reductase [Bordetella pseudohinzii]KXA80092.1 beta-ketoacyl-ACP reductase [Bordetella pseudohinzii]CUI78245.1 3-oxoacyl-[acyl-carrier-protein] reductase FabG [Bordetella pseudohinzii]